MYKTPEKPRRSRLGPPDNFMAPRKAKQPEIEMTDLDMAMWLSRE